jgi:hypothetical protein
MIKYGDAFKFPFTNVKKLLIGTLIASVATILATIGYFWFAGNPVYNVFSLAANAVAAFVVTGYFLAVAAGVLGKQKKLPEWKGWGTMILKGFYAFVVSFIYFLPGLLLSVYLAIKSGMVDMSRFLPAGQKLTIAGVGGFGGAIMIVAAVALLFLIFYLLPMALVGLVRKGFLGAFDFNGIFKRVFTMKYLIAWGFMFFYALIAKFLLASVPLIGTGFASFITGVTGFSVYAQAYSLKK